MARRTPAPSGPIAASEARARSKKATSQSVAIIQSEIANFPKIPQKEEKLWNENQFARGNAHDQKQNCGLRFRQAEQTIQVSEDEVTQTDPGKSEVKAGHRPKGEEQHLF